nr:MAG TPA: cysteine sulfinate desulfinase/cysteine desulfurase [Caudoviricetes sp.]
MIYLDNAATTQIDTKVLDAMLPYLESQFGNPGGIYKLGRDARAAVEKARKQVADLINAEPDQIVFTSGATEANNMVFTITQQMLEESGRKDIYVSAIEHQSVLKSAQNMAVKHGFYLHAFMPQKDFFSEQHYLAAKVNKDTALVSAMYANNEVGFIQNVHEIGRICQQNGAMFHTDCVQAAGCNPIDVQSIRCDFATLSAHKIHGPKGVGALFIKDKERFSPMIFGGSDQEFGLRGGTENVAGIVGFGKACELAKNCVDNGINTYFYNLGKAFASGLQTGFVQSGNRDYRWYFNGSTGYGIKTISITFPRVDAQSLILALDNQDVCVSAGSACDSHDNVPSHVLKAFGLSDDAARQTIRVSFSRMNTGEEVFDAGEIVGRCVMDLLKTNGYQA